MVVEQRDRLITVPEAADQIGRSVDSLKWLIRTGRGPESRRIDGRRMFRQSDVDRYIAGEGGASGDVAR